MSINFRSGNIRVEVAARKHYTAVGTYDWIYDITVYPTEGGKMEAAGLYESPTVKVLQVFTGLALRELRTTCVMAQDECLREEIAARKPHTLTWVLINTEHNDQQADLPGSLWAQIGPESSGGWSWVVFDFDQDNAEVGSGIEHDEYAAKTMVNRVAEVEGRQPTIAAIDDEVATFLAKSIDEVQS